MVLLSLAQTNHARFLYPYWLLEIVCFICLFFFKYLSIARKLWSASTHLLNGGSYVVCTCRPNGNRDGEVFYTFFFFLCIRHGFPFLQPLFRGSGTCQFLIGSLYSLLPPILPLYSKPHAILCFLKECFPIGLELVISLFVMSLNRLDFYCMYIGYNTRRLVWNK